MMNTERIELSMIPKRIRDAYISRDKNSYLVNIVARQNPWIEENRRILTQQLSTVTDRATGMIFAADQLNEIAKHDGVKAAITAIVVIFLLLLIDFRNLKLSLITLLTLFLSIGTLFGIMGLTGIRFDFVNVISVPLLIGIGIDDVFYPLIDESHEEYGNRFIGGNGTCFYLFCFFSSQLAYNNEREIINEYSSPGRQKKMKKAIIVGLIYVF